MDLNMIWVKKESRFFAKNTKFQNFIRLKKLQKFIPHHLLRCLNEL
jgi:hypothetical protein